MYNKQNENGYPFLDKQEIKCESVSGETDYTSGERGLYILLSPALATTSW